MRRRGVRGLGAMFGLTSVDQLTGNLVDTGTGQVIGNCGNLLDWGFYMSCWGVSPATWKAKLPTLTDQYVPPVAPSNDTAAAAVDTGTEDQLIQDLTNQSILATQAANLASVQNQLNVPGCDPTADLFGCLGGLAWYWWALIAGGGLFAISAMKR